MINQYEPKSAKIIRINQEAPGVKSYQLQFVDPKQQKDFFFFPGQFLMFSIPGFGEAPVGISSSSQNTDTFEIAVREAGKLTTELHQKKTGDVLGIRGPLGKGYFPTKKLNNRNLLLIAGGIGIIPLRAIILDILGKPEIVNKSQLFYGAKSENDMLFKEEISTWQKTIDVNLTVDKHVEYSPEMQCGEGLITDLFKTQKIHEKPLAYIVGPPVMCKFVINALHEAKVPDEDIYISLERHMQCGVGDCHHCGIGNKLVCKDGPVFKYADINNIKDAV
ncbi:FAD/NAD(P)-binding protein [Patescibacteria group bacterium]